MASTRNPNGQNRRRAPRGKSPQGMSLTFLILILFILAIVVFILAFREPLARFAATRQSPGAQATASAEATPSPSVKPAGSGKPSQLVIDGATPSPSLAAPSPTASPRPAAASPSPEPSPKAGAKNQRSPSPSAKPGKSPSPPPTPVATDKEDLKTVELYFAKVDGDGRIMVEKVKRSLKFNDSPLSASINALLRGPDSGELSAGMISMIPAGTRLLSAQVGNGVATLNFSESFQFNPYGADGLRAQLRQVVYVATQFQGTVKAVQILIEGKKEEYLGGDNVSISGPLTRANLP